MTAPANRLAGESSPYLLQHAHNPVDWFPWGPEALGRAKAEDKPILLSVGYSACHWCHVMERESFEDPTVAGLMNQHFVPVKVDREERPDLDQLYQTAVQVLGGQGGWPLTIFLTPQLEPFFGGTYYPPQPRYGMPSFTQVLTGVAEAWQQRRSQVEMSAEQLRGVLREIESAHEAAQTLPGRDLVLRAADSLVRRYDADHGGFGQRPKFPNTLLLELWLRVGAQDGGQPFLERVAFTLEQMCRGGLYDQLGGGFHRYSTDERWLVPHFEKMLYDNALFLRLYVQGFQATGDALFAQVARETADYVLREMTDAEGGFYSTQDADSEGVEGKFFVWDEAELVQLLGEREARLVARSFGVVPGGNFEHGKSILHRPMPLASAAQLEGFGESEAAQILVEARRKLFEAREKRVKPFRDDKVLAGWNGLMLHAFALAGAALAEPRYTRAAERCSDFVFRALWREGRLLRSWRQGQAKIEAFSEDYALLAEGHLQLFAATGKAVHFERARTLVDAALDLFFDAQKGGFFLAAKGQGDLVERPRATYDNATPAATSSLTHALLQLHALTGEGRYGDAADLTLRAFGEQLAKNAFGHGYLLCALESATAGLATLVVTGAAGDPAREALLATARHRFLPHVLVLPWSGEGTLPQALAGLLQGKDVTSAAAYFCRGMSCSLPVTDPQALGALLAGSGA